MSSTVVAHLHFFLGWFYKLGRVYFVGYFEQISYLFRGRYAGIATEER